MVQGLGADLPPVYGLVLTSRKNDPLVEMPIVAGKANDPLLAQWKTGLGKSAIFSSDATSRWANQWVGSSSFSKFWAQVIRSVARAPMSRDMDVQTRVEGDKIRITADAMDPDKRSINFLNVSGQIIGPDMKVRDLQLNQIGPGRYEAVVDKAQVGAHIARLSYTGPKGESGWQVAGVSLSNNPEMRDLRSNDALLEQVAARTGGRLLEPWNVGTADLFSRDGLKKSASPMPIWDILLLIVMALLLVDVAVRRIAWDFRAIMAAAGRYADTLRSRRQERSESVEALKRLRDGSHENPAATTTTPVVRPEPGEVPDRARKFEGKGIEGNLTDIVSGARLQEPRPADAPKGSMPAADKPGEHTSSLLAAKRRARDQMDKKDNK